LVIDKPDGALKAPIAKNDHIQALRGHDRGNLLALAQTIVPECRPGIPGLRTLRIPFLRRPIRVLP